MRAGRGGGGFHGRGGGGFRGGGGGFRGGGRGGGRRSDITVKHDIVLLGQLANCLGYYRFSYNGSDRAYVGVMAQEVQQMMPHATVRDRDGILRVYYDKIGVKFQSYEGWLSSGARLPNVAPVPNRCSLAGFAIEDARRIRPDGWRAIQASGLETPDGEAQ